MAQLSMEGSGKLYKSCRGGFKIVACWVNGKQR
jgi:hypothetical protein